jgi:hypothetical protein
MRGARAVIFSLLAALALSGCLRTSTPVASGEHGDLDTMSDAVALADGFSPRSLRDRVTHTDDSGSSRVVASLGTALSASDTVLVDERWF